MSTLLFGGVLLSAAALRLFDIGAEEITSDEAFSWRLTQYPVGELLRRTAADVHPPLYYLLLWCMVAVLGDSLAAMRAVSAVYGVLALIFLRLALKDGLRLRIGPAKGPGTSRIGREPPLAAGLLAVALGAFHWGQVQLGRSARMYGLGLLLAALSSWLLVRALQKRTSLRAWLAYAAAAASLCLTHNFGWFTVLGQALFASGYAVAYARHHGTGPALSLVGRIAFAFAFVLVVYLPWIPALLHQIDEVGTEFWVRRPDAAQARNLFVVWAVGAHRSGELEFAVLSLLLLGALLRTTASRSCAAWLFLLQALVPWGGACAFSIGTGQTILLDRCLGFAQLALLAYVALVIEELRNPLLRRVGRAVALSMALLATVSQYATQPSLPTSAHREAMAIVHIHYRPGDVFVAHSPHQLNRLKYYAHRQRTQDIPIRVEQMTRGRGHRVHVASLAGADFFHDPEDLAGYARIWSLESVLSVDVEPYLKDYACQRLAVLPDPRGDLILSLYNK